MWIVWDRKSPVNGYSAEWFLDNHKSLAKNDVIFFKMVGDRVTQTEGKNTLAKVHNLDPTLTNDEFIAAYEAKLAELEEQARLEAPDEPIEEPEPEPEPDETATYAELAQVYKEGVNGLE